MPGQDRGEVIVYCMAQRAKLILEKWRDRLVVKDADIEIFDDQIAIKLSFRSRHVHEKSGLKFITRHRILALYFSPCD